MAKAKKKRSGKKKRPPVNKAERVAATPETLAKLRPCPLKAMLERPELGFEPQHYEACMVIWDAHVAVSRKLKAKGGAFNERTDKAHTEDGTRLDHLISVYLDWSRTLTRRMFLKPETVVDWIEDHDSGQRLANDAQRHALVKACDWWIDCMDDADRARRVERQGMHREPSLAY
jgi:hypothetical protein